MSNKFKAIVLNQSGEKFSREIKILDKSFFKVGNVLVKVDYSGLNYKDALILKIQAFWGTNRPLAIISIILFVFVLWMVAEGCVAFKKGKRHQNF